MFHRLTATAGKSIGFLKEVVIANHPWIDKLGLKARKSLPLLCFEKIKIHALQIPNPGSIPFSFHAAFRPKGRAYFQAGLLWAAQGHGSKLLEDRFQ
jgi:hypothetical protein